MRHDFRYRPLSLSEVMHSHPAHNPARAPRPPSLEGEWGNRLDRRQGEPSAASSRRSLPFAMTPASRKASPFTSCDTDRKPLSVTSDPLHSKPQHRQGADRRSSSSPLPVLWLSTPYSDIPLHGFLSASPETSCPEAGRRETVPVSPSCLRRQSHGHAAAPSSPVPAWLCTFLLRHHV